MPYIGKEPARVPFAAEDIPNDSITAAKIVDGAITIADIADDAVTEDKLANAINTAIAANTAKVTNATHTGEVTGATALTIAADAVDGTNIADNAIGNEHIEDDAVGIAELSATGTAGNTTFLRGDNSWQTAGSTSASDLTSGTLPIARIADDAVTNAKMADDAIDSAQIADGAVDNAHLATGIDAAKLTTGTLPGARLSGITVARTNVTTEGQVEASKFVTADGNAYVNFGDGEKIRMGNGNDLQIYHDASDSIITDNGGTGNLKIASDDLYIRNAADTETQARFSQDGAVSLYHNNAVKLATNLHGVDVTGNIYGDNNTEIGSHPSYSIKRIRMLQGGEIHFGDTTTGNGFGITEGAWDDFGDYDRMGIYCRNELKIYGNSNALRLTLNGTNGNVDIGGALSKGSGSFRIPHPLPALTATKNLVHSFIEGPQADLIYRGVVTLSSGSATVNIDTEGGMTEGTFVLLCGNVSCFTTNESNWDAVKASVTGNVLTIESENASSTAKVSWLVIGERIDQHMLDTDWTDASGKVIVEPDKAVDSAEMADK